MPKSCLDGYLTDECASCPDWKDGTKEGEWIGCGTHMPIMMCPYFAQMVEKEEKENDLDNNSDNCFLDLG